MRKFKSYAIRREEAVGIGIEEYTETVTLSIASIYLPYNPSHKELFHLIARYVVDQLEGEEVALLRYTRPLQAKYQWKRRYNQTSLRLYAQDEPTTHVPFLQTQQLAKDALERQASVFEGLPEGYVFKVEL